MTQLSALSSRAPEFSILRERGSNKQNPLFGRVSRTRIIIFSNVVFRICLIVGALQLGLPFVALIVGGFSIFDFAMQKSVTVSNKKLAEADETIASLQDQVNSGRSNSEEVDKLQQTVKKLRDEVAARKAQLHSLKTKIREGRRMLEQIDIVRGH